MNIDLNISNQVKIDIMRNHIEKLYMTDVRSLISGKKKWKKTGQIFETISKILLAFGGIVSFSAGYYDDQDLSFVAGSLSVFSLSMLQISAFSYMESKKQTNELNIILKKLGLDTVPEIIRESERVSPEMYMRGSNVKEDEEDNIKIDIDIEKEQCY